MHLLRVRLARSALALSAAVALLLPGCGAPSPSETTSQGESDDDSSDSDPSDDDPSATNTSQATEGVDSSTTEPPVGWFIAGWGDGEFVPLADGDPFPIVLGGQGAQMFPMPLQGGEWYLPGNPTSWMDETGPLVDFEMDIEGFNDGPGGHFKRIANYTLDWVVLPDGTYQSSFLPIIVPDGVAPEDIEGLPAHLFVRLRPYEQPAVELELDVVVAVGPAPG
jgi:hypothetical protein